MVLYFDQPLILRHDKPDVKPLPDFTEPVLAGGNEKRLVLVRFRSVGVTRSSMSVQPSQA